MAGVYKAHANVLGRHSCFLDGMCNVSRRPNITFQNGVEIILVAPSFIVVYVAY